MENPTPAPVATAPTAPTPPPQDPSEITAEDRLFAALGYIPLLFVLPSAFKPKSAFCQKHAKQGMILSGAFFATLLIMAIIPALGLLLFLGLLALIVVGAIKAHSGQESSLPGLAKLALPGKGKAQAAPAATAAPTRPAPPPPAAPATPTPPATPATPAPTPTPPAAPVASTPTPPPPSSSAPTIN